MKLLCGVECDGEETFGNCPQRRDGKCRTVKKLEMCQIGAIADHLIANGAILQPCKVGDTVYILFGEPSHTIKELRVRTIVFGETHDSIGFTNKSVYTIWDKRWYDFFGKIIFTTREGAERALKGEHNAEIH
jgi:hypothetical protein